jgi:hypothetical protein
LGDGISAWGRIFFADKKLPLRYPVAVLLAMASSRPLARLVLAGLLALVVAAPGGAQNRSRRPATRAGSAQTGAASSQANAPIRETPLMQCPSVLGNGTRSQRLFCDVLIGSHAEGGLRITIPPHEGKATLLFTMHNRQNLTPDAAKKDGSPAYARYTATLRVLAPNGNELTKAVVQSEYRSQADLVERIAGGAGPGGVKAVAPTGSEPIVVDLPPGLTEVSLVGEKLTIERLDGSETVTTAGRPIAVVSQVFVEYQPVVSTTTAGKRRS